jgi:hypothetical protein
MYRRFLQTAVSASYTSQLYRDFIAVCRTRTVPEIQAFYDVHILPGIRSESEAPGFYYELMGNAYLELRNIEKKDPVTEWFQQIAIKNHPLK